MEIKVNIGDPKAGKTYQRTIPEDDAKVYFGKKLGDTLKGELLGLPGYEFTIAGGSDYCGFPMRKDVEGTLRKRILLVSGIGLRKNREGRRVRKAVAGNTIYARTAQLNLKVTKHGSQPLGGADTPAQTAQTEE
jgi:small subunit ribosomal protein S6e